MAYRIIAKTGDAGLKGEGMNRTKIEWVKNPDGTPGYTFNPITGCLNGCPYCYARKLANGRLKQRYLANSYYAPNDKCDASYLKGRYDPFYPRFWPEKLKQIQRYPFCIPEAKIPKAKGIFVCDMSDLFGKGIPEVWTEEVIEVIEQSPQNRYYLLTKQPQNLAKFSPFPDNCWVGISVTRQGELTGAMDCFMNIEAKIKYISFEPLLEEMSTRMISSAEYYKWIDWLIIGSQTKPYRPPEISWVKEIVEAAGRAGVPVFLKDNLKPIFLNRTADWAFQKPLKTPRTLRQEMPR